MTTSIVAVWTVLVALGFLGDATFVVLYARDDWWGSPIGRNLMAMAAILAALFGLTLVGFLWRPPAWLWLGGMGSLDLVLWWRVAILVAMHARRRRR